MTETNTPTLQTLIQSGISFKAQHADQIFTQRPEMGWFEVHPENYMVAGGPRHAMLTHLREQYPLSLHGVALSLAGADPVSADHLSALKALVDRYDPFIVSEHLAWSAHGRHYFADLLPIPLNEASLNIVCDNVDRTQEALGRQILVENPSLYLPLDGNEIDEPIFLTELARRSGCKLLLDVNNVYVSTQNIGGNAQDYIDAIDGDLIGEVHLAGHAMDDAGPKRLLIDDHGSMVCDPVWDLYARLMKRVGSKPTLVEWDTNLPDLDTLLSEAEKAGALMKTAIADEALA